MATCSRCFDGFHTRCGGRGGCSCSVCASRAARKPQPKPTRPSAPRRPKRNPTIAPTPRPARKPEPLAPAAASSPLAWIRQHEVSFEAECRRLAEVFHG